jgi:hypothetical protein
MVIHCFPESLCSQVSDEPLWKLQVHNSKTPEKEAGADFDLA